MSNIDYADGLTLTGKATIGTLEDIDCELVIVNNAFPQLKMADSYFHKNQPGKLEGEPNFITFTSKWELYTLYNNKLSGMSFIPQYIVAGSKSGEINGVDISLFGLYSFFDGQSSFEVKDSCISKSINDFFVKTDFDIEGELYHYSVEHDYNYSKKIDTTTLVEDAIVRIWNPRRKMSFDEIKNVVKKVRVLFSLLLGFDLPIKQTWLVNKHGQRENSFYFFAPSSSLPPFEQPHECFVYSSQLLTENDWANILNYTFNDNAVNPILEFWVRLVSMFSYKGFWEYEILGVVSMVDAYSKSHHKVHTEKRMKLRQFDKLRGEIKAVVHEYKKTLPEDGNYSATCEVINNMLLQIGYIKNTNAQDFSLILNLLMGTISPNIKNLIGFKNTDFEMIIKIRNSAAHGSPVDDEIMKNIQRAMIVKEKIKFLMLYLFFKSIGFADDYFVKLCDKSFNKIKLGAQLDSYTLRVTYGDGLALNVDAENFKKAKEMFAINIPIIHHAKSEYFEVGNEILSTVIKTMSAKNRGRFINIVDLIYAEYLNSEVFSVEYKTAVFLCNENERLELNGVYLVAMND